VTISRAGRPELAITALTIAATAGAGYAMAGPAGLALVVVIAAVVVLVALRVLVPDDAAGRVADPRHPRPQPRPVSVPAMTGYWRQRHSVAGGTTELNSYETGLRPTLEHLLAARLAERHGINLYEEPAAARRAFCRDKRDAQLWSWISPEREPGPAANRFGIPRRTLARILDRLEQL
jgi:hypothetical protein